MSAAVTNGAAVGLSAIWTRRRDEILAAVAVVEDAVRDGLVGRLDDARRECAYRETHKLVGSAGTFGFLTAGEIAHELERALSAPVAPSPEECARLAVLVVALRRELEADSPAAPAAPAAASDLLVVGADHERMHALAGEAAARGLVAIVARSPAAARAIIERSRPRILLLDPVVPGGLDAAVAFLAEMSPSVPILVLTDPAGDLDRVEVARRGGRGFLPRSLAVTELIDHVVGLRERLRAEETTVLAVDDDRTILAAIRAVLERDGLTVQTCADPGQLWEELERLTPDLLVLDIEMPGVSGLELCRAVRNDPRWAALPVLILTARRDAGTVETVFAAGADDYIAKPFSGGELTHRIANRLERVRLLRALADTDHLTGLANRRRATEAIETYQLLSRRSGEPLCMAVLDVDAFKRINTALGHAGGDATLRRVGRALAEHFRGEDIVSRWGGDEFVIGMFGMTLADALERMDEFVEHIRAAAFGAGENRKTVTISAGLAEFPTDGVDVESLYRAADASLYDAKAAGGDRACFVGQNADLLLHADHGGSAS
jgi:diguanylate cyclase (GGDEF)-like protein